MVLILEVLLCSIGQVHKSDVHFAAVFAPLSMLFHQATSLVCDNCSTEINVQLDTSEERLTIGDP